MFRLNTMDAQKIIESIPNKYDYDKIVVFIDFDNMLFIMKKIIMILLCMCNEWFKQLNKHLLNYMNFMKH